MTATIYQIEPALVSVAATQHALGLGKTTVYDLIKGGQLETVKLGRRRLVKVASIHALANREAA